MSMGVPMGGHNGSVADEINCVRSNIAATDIEDGIYHE